MSVYFVVQFTIRDDKKFESYAVTSRETIRQFGGRVIARGVANELHGKAAHKMGAIVEFPDRETAQKWYSSESYQRLVPQREDAADSVFLLYDGFGG